MKNPHRWGVLITLACAVLALIALGVMPTSAQTFRGSIMGTVTDSTGAAIVNAKVSIKNADTGVERVTETTVDGQYLVPELPIGTYTVTIELSLFQKSVTQGVVVDVAAMRRVDAALQPGTMNSEIVVSGEQLPQVETTSDVLGGVLTQDSVKDLPIIFHERGARPVE